MKNKIVFPQELAYILYIFILSFAVACTAASNLGLSMIVSPAYIIHMWLDKKIIFGHTLSLTFGQAEYVVQGILFVAFCIILKRVKLVYFSSFITGIIYGFVLDTWRAVIPYLNPDVTIPGSMAMEYRILFYVLGTILTSFSIAVCFRSYFYPQVYDFFVKGVSAHFNKDRSKFKIAFDASCLIVSVALTLLIFRKFVGVGVGTIITTCVNGLLIKFFDTLLCKYFEFKPIFKKFSTYFNF